MAEAIAQQDVCSADFDQMQAATPEGLAWLKPLRAEAMEAFRSLGWPTVRDEEWRFTNLKPMAKIPFERAAGGDVGTDAVERASLEGNAARVVLVDGRFRPELSDLSGLPDRVEVRSLAEVAEREPERVREHLAQYADFRAEPFTALNTAFLADGAFIEVPRNMIVDGTVQIIHVSTVGERPTVSHPRVLVLIGESGGVTLVESFVGTDDGVYWSNAVTEAVLDENAELRHYLLQRDSETAYNMSTLRAYQKRDSRLESHSGLVGAALTRNNVIVEMQGPGAWSQINGLYLGHESQHHDNFMRVIHAQPHCSSRQFYRGVLDDQAKAVFNGRIVVHEGAQKTDAVQQHQALQLTNDTETSGLPQLEIYADDVKCTHGSTTGQIDEKAVFYLRTRGMSERAARAMMTYAFAQENLQRMSLDAAREQMGRLLLERLPESDVLKSMS